jgi:hypothetical protein
MSRRLLNGKFVAVTRVLALPVAMIPAIALALAEDQSQRGQAEEPDSFDVEPPILKKNLLDDRSTPAAAGDAVERLQKKLEEAKGDAKGVERLCKIGVLSKVEMEQRLLKVIQCEAEQARDLPMPKRKLSSWSPASHLAKAQAISSQVPKLP